MNNIDEILKEWAAIATTKPLKNRMFDIERAIQQAKTRLVSITGIRRAGKSSVLMLIHRYLLSRQEKAVYIDLEDDRLKFQGVLDEILKHAPDTKWFLLDEITSAGMWENWLHRIAEMRSVHVIVSSSLNKLSRYPPKPLRGRVSYFELFPLSFAEFLRFKEVETNANSVQGIGKMERELEEFLQYGGFPEVVLSNEKVSILQEYLNSIVALDVSTLSNVPFGTVLDFSHQLVRSPVFSASKMENTMKSIGHKIGKATILELEKLFERAYLAFFVPIFSTKVKDERQYPRKVYMGDVGFLYAITGKRNLGRMYENSVFLQLRRKANPLEQISYYRSVEEYEVDFVVREGAEVRQLIQVVYDMEDETTRNREMRALVKAAEEFSLNGQNQELLTITRSKEGKEIVDGKKIQFIPLWKWLLQE